MSDQELRVPAGLTTEGLLGRRYMARIIDTVVLTLLVLGMGAVAAAAGLVGAAVIVALLIPCMLYGAVMESSPMQATIGKRVMSLRVYNAQGGRIGFLQALGRNLVKDGPFFVFNLIPGGRFLSILWLVCHLVVMHRSPVYQAIHDRALETWVAAPEQVTQLRIA